MKRILSVLFLLMFLASSCNDTTNDSGRNTEEYEYVPLTDKLVEELGGASNLKHYQLFLSERLTLRGVINTKSAGGEGSVYSRDDFYEITLTAGTPGVINTYIDLTGLLCEISVFFDEGPDDFLTFEPSYSNGKGIFYIANTPDDRCQYKGMLCSYDGNPYLLVQMKKEEYRHTEKAKGRLIE